MPTRVISNYFLFLLLSKFYKSFKLIDRLTKFKIMIYPKPNLLSYRRQFHEERDSFSLVIVVFRADKKQINNFLDHLFISFIRFNFVFYHF